MLIERRYAANEPFRKNVREQVGTNSQKLSVEIYSVSVIFDIPRELRARPILYYANLGSNVRALALLCIKGNKSTDQNLTKFGRNPVRVALQSTKSSK